MSIHELVMLTALLANLFGADPGRAQCVVYHESRYVVDAVNGEHLGLAQFKIETMRWGLEQMGIDWDWEAMGDPRLHPPTALAVMAYLMGRGYTHWWSTYRMCERIGREGRDEQAGRLAGEYP